MAAHRSDDDLADGARLPRSASTDAASRRLRRALSLVLVLALALVGLVVASAAGDDQPFAWQQPFLLAPSSLPPAAGTGYPLADVACGSASLCVAVADAGTALTTTDPAGGGDAWTPSAVSPDDLRSASCPSPGLCVVADDEGIVFTTTNPGAVTPHWESAAATPEGIGGLSCPTASLCVAVDDGGSVVTSTHPTSGSGAWTAAAVDAANAPLTAIDCPSASLCVAVDGWGNVVASHDPTGGAQAWSVDGIDAHALVGISCPTTTLCAAVDETGSVLTSTDPAGGVDAWQVSGSLGPGATALACPSADRCLATTSTDVLVSDDPTGGSGTWHSVHVGNEVELTGLACPSLGFCVGVDERGFALTGSGGPPVGAVAVTLDGDGRGTVSGGGIACPPTCGATLVRGSVVSLSAAPAPGSTFAGWSGPCAGTGRCDVTVARATTLGARFGVAPPPPGYTLTVTVGGHGTVTGPGVSCPPTCAARHPAGDAVPLVATPDPGWRFAGWGGACRGRGSCTPVARADQVVSALFESVPVPRPGPVPGRASIARWSKTAHGHGARFVFHVTPRGRGTRCALVRVVRPRPAPRYADCRSPKAYAHLGRGRYVFSVRAKGRPAEPAATQRFRLR